MTVRALPILSLFFVCSALGCQNDEARVYSAPKDQVAETPALGTPQMPASHPSTAPIQWTVPDGWREVPGSGMRFATLLIESEDPPLEVRVTPLGLAAKDPLANVNRWGQQIGLDPIDASQLDETLKSIGLDGGREVRWANLQGPTQDATPPQQVLAAMVESDQSIWFFVLMDEAGRVGKHASTFENFLKTIRFDAPAQTMTQAAPPPAAPAQGLPAAALGTTGEQMTWTAPNGWTLSKESSAMRVATFAVQHQTQSAEVAITRFPGNVGGLLPNINRWRGQLGLQPIGDLSQQPLEQVDIAGQAAKQLDLSAAAQDKRMFVVLVQRPEMTWFVKMTGPSTVLEGQQDSFNAFLRSIKFEAQS